MKKLPRPINKLVFKNELYEIREIPLNYIIRVFASRTVEKIKDDRKVVLREKVVPQPYYLPLNRSVEYAKETAEYLIKKYQHE